MFIYIGLYLIQQQNNLICCVHNRLVSSANMIESSKFDAFLTGLLQLSVKVLPAFLLKSSILPSNFSKIYI